MDETMIRYLLSIGINPFDPSFGNTMGGVMPTLDSGAPDANTNTVQDILQLQSDPAFIATLGDAPGGFTGQDFAGTTITEPVEAPGYATMQRYLNSGDPVARYIAEVLTGDPVNGVPPGTANQAEAEIRKIVNDPTNPLYEEMSQYVFTYDDNGEVKQDWSQVRNLASTLESSIISDPQISGFDEMGRPVSQTTEESEASKYFREAGLPTPSERYGYETVNPENYQRIVEARSGIQPQLAAAEGYRGERDAGREAMMKMLSDQGAPASGASTQAGPQRGGAVGLAGDVAGAYGQEFKNRIPGANGLDVSMDGMKKAMTGMLFGWNNDPSRSAPEPRERIDLSGVSRENLQSAADMAPDLIRQAMHKIGMGDYKLPKQKKQIMESSKQMLAAQRDAKDRNLGIGNYQGTNTTKDWKTLRRLEEQGRTPLNDTLAARRQAMLRYGIQT